MLIRDTNGHLYYEIAGDGPPLVFVSGWAMSCECWRPAVSMRKRKYRCLIYDNRGVARSQPSSIDANFTVESHAEDLHSLMEATGVFDATIIGHELGSLIAAANSAQHPQDTRSLIVVNPRHGFSEDDVRSLAVFTPASLALRELAAYPLLRNLVARRFRRAPQPYRDTLFADFADLSPRAAYETAVSASSDQTAMVLDDAVREARFPVLIICGDKDKKGAAEARRLFALAGAGKLATLRDCGFLPMLEYRRQFAKLIEDYVSIQQKAHSRAIVRS